MFDRKTILVLILLSHSFIALAKENKSKIAALTPKQLEEAKKFFKNINEYHEKVDKPLQQSASGGYRSKVGISGGTKFADDLFFSIFPLGDKHGGLPDTLLGLGKYCV
jgi:hypothetical protein